MSNNEYTATLDNNDSPQKTTQYTNSDTMSYNVKLCHCSNDIIMHNQLRDYD